MEADLYPLFGGYWGYMSAPVHKVRKHQLRWLAVKQYESEQEKKNKPQQDEIDKLNAQYALDDD